MFLYSKTFFTQWTKERFNKNILYSASLYFLHFRKKFSILILQKILSLLTTILMLLLFFFFKEIFISLTSILVFLVLFFSIKILISFTCFFSKLFFVIFVYSKKKIRTILSVFLYALKIDFTI